jgi:uncharacterized protein YbjT (DUF2867 family)
MVTAGTALSVTMCSISSKPDMLRDASLYLVVYSVIDESIRNMAYDHSNTGVAEEIIEDSRIPFTFLRPNFFMQNFVNIYGAMIKKSRFFLFVCWRWKG